jgi:mRNA-degrading endonuclease YafQ of YafQ-DinJ toxin-antitoxin module
MLGYKNLWKCKYIYDWRLIFAVDENIITLIDLDRRDTIYRFFVL